MDTQPPRLGPTRRSSFGSRVYIPERKGTLQVEMVSASASVTWLVYPRSRGSEGGDTELDAGTRWLSMQRTWQFTGTRSGTNAVVLGTI